MNIWDKIFKAGAKEVVDSVGNALDKVFTNKEELVQAKLEVEKEVNRHMEVLLDKALDQEKIYIQDVANARAMQMAALNQDDKFSKRFIYYMAAFILIAATGFGVGLFFWKVPEENKRLVEMFADIYLFGGAIMILQFFFGSSKSSHDKDNTIKNIQ